MTGLVCPNCGTTNRASAKFCMRCVTSLGDDVPSSFDPTMFDPRTVVCPAPDSVLRARQAVRQATSVHALPDGTTLDGFRIVRPLGEGGFGIVYLAWDMTLERHVALKEYMPYALVSREGSTLDVTLRAERDRPVFDAGLKSFVNEARLLARFDHPALVKVFRFWEANRTAYMAMPYYEGPTLKAALAELAGPATEQQLRDWLDPLLEALQVIHGEQCYHRDISPDNILLTPGGPLLLDFGAARRVISDRTQALTAMLKPGFAPVEQYGGAMLQGAWTDLYALAGVVRYAITGRPPVASISRVVDDPQRPLAQTHAGRYSEGFLRAVDTALAVRPELRPQDVAAFRALLAVGPRSDEDDGFLRTQVVPRADAASAFPRTARIAPPPSLPLPEANPAMAAPAPPVPPPAPVEAEPTAFGELATETDAGFYSTTVRAPIGTPARRRRWVPLLGAMVLAGTAGAVWFAWPRPVAAPPPTAASAPTAPPVTAAAQPLATAATQGQPTPTSAPAPAPAAAAAAAAMLASVPVPASTPVPVPVPVSVAKVPAARAPRTTAVERPVAVVPSVPMVSNTAARNEHEVTSSYAQPARPPRCGELVLKASLETLSPDEVALLKSRCR